MVEWDFGGGISEAGRRSDYVISLWTSGRSFEWPTYVVSQCPLAQERQCPRLKCHEHCHQREHPTFTNPSLKIMPKRRASKSCRDQTTFHRYSRSNRL
jgi:hypothetical protein